MKIASIDIGTNAIKSKIFKTTPTSIEYLKGIRSPIRLGDEVFNKGKLSKGKLDLVIKTLKEYEEIISKSRIEAKNNFNQVREKILKDIFSHVEF